MTPNTRNIQPLSATSQVGLNKAQEPASENPTPQDAGGALGVQKEEAKPAQTQNVGAALKESESGSSASDKPEEKKTAYVPYKKPQLRPEYRRRPGAWAQQYAERTKLAEKEKAIEAAKAEEAKKNENNTPENHDSQNTVKHENAQTHAPEVAANGAVMLENPIPHPARKTEHHPMEYDVDIKPDMSDYDIKISDDDDFDI